MIFADTMSWQHFSQLNHIKKLPLNEQIQMYNRYLMEQQEYFRYVMEQQAALGGGKKEEPEVSVNCISFVMNTANGGNTAEFEVDTSSEITATIDWGDGTEEEETINGNLTFTHTYDEGGEYTVNLCFSDPTAVTQLNFLGDD